MKYTQGIVLCPGDREQKGGEREYIQIMGWLNKIKKGQGILKRTQQMGVIMKERIKGGDDWRFGVIHIHLLLWLLLFFIKMCIIFMHIDGK